MRGMKRVGPLVSTAACTAAALVLTALPAGAAGQISPAGADGSKLMHLQTRTSLLGKHIWYQQTYHGLPVVDGFYVRHVDRKGKTSKVDDGRKRVPSDLATTPSVSAARAKSVGRVAAARLARTAGHGKRPGAPNSQPRVRSTRLAVAGGSAPALVWQVVTEGADGVVRTLVNARSGATVAVKPLSHGFDGTGRVFDPNPVVALRNQKLTDKKDADYRQLARAYRTVKLKNLTDPKLLIGKWAQNTNDDAVSSARHRFVFGRDKAGFEQTSGYYGITKAQRYFRSLGITDANAESQKYDTNTFEDDNSFYDGDADKISFGSGGVDDAEDLEVVWHEYGHAVQDDQSPGFGTTEEAGAIGEGFGDYLAVTMSVPTGRGYEPTCVMDWDATSYTDTEPHCLRRTDTDKTVDDKTGEVHDDGEIWSAALWEINRTLGRVQADRMILESQFYYRPDTSFAQAAQNVVSTARSMYGRATAAKVAQIFAKRKIVAG